MRRLLPLASLLVLALATGCGGGDELGEPQDRQTGAGGEQVAASDVESILRARQVVTTACEGPGTDERELTAAIDELVVLIEEDPSGRFETGNTETIQTLSSIGDEVSGALERCDQPQLARRVKAVSTGERPEQEGSPGY